MSLLKFQNVQVISISEFGIDLNTFVREISSNYSHYEEDFYLTRQRKIEYLKSNLSLAMLNKLSKRFWCLFYANGISNEEEKNLISSLSAESREAYFNINSNRKRLISEYTLKYNKAWEIERIPLGGFRQEYALISNQNDQDYRLLSERKFKQLPNVMFNTTLKNLLIGYANKVKEINNKICALTIVVHHTLVFCSENNMATNSPEGVHQDGMDYIVSALVVERKNIIGGKSLIFGEDKKTVLLDVVLEPGQSILQPDKNSPLWHTVTPITPIEKNKEAYRSSIGFDIMESG